MYDISLIYYITMCVTTPFSAIQDPTTLKCVRPWRGQQCWAVGDHSSAEYSLESGHYLFSFTSLASFRSTYWKAIGHRTASTCFWFRNDLLGLTFVYGGGISWSPTFPAIFFCNANSQVSPTLIIRHSRHPHSKTSKRISVIRGLSIHRLVRLSATLDRRTLVWFSLPLLEAEQFVPTGLLLRT